MLKDSLLAHMINYIMVFLKKINRFLALGFASGLLPKAPGTWGTLASIPIYCLLAQLSLPIYMVTVISLTIIGVFICEIAANDFSELDPPSIVWDEFCGFWITMMWLPYTWTWILAGFILFRVFDIWKPWPIKIVEKKCRGGLGIMLDDVVAAIYTWPLLYVLQVIVNRI